MLRLGVLISGSGRTLTNLLDRQGDGTLQAEVLSVISSRPQGGSNAAIFRRCKRDGIPVSVIRRATFNSQATFSSAQALCFEQHRLDLVCMAGYLCFWRIPAQFDRRVLNIHPSLLPRFGGKGFYGQRVHEAVLESGTAESGCTVHFADNEYDHGDIILQKVVPVKAGDTPADLAARVFRQECLAYPEAINRLAANGARVGQNVQLHHE